MLTVLELDYLSFDLLIPVLHDLRVDGKRVSLFVQRELHYLVALVQSETQSDLLRVLLFRVLGH